MYTEDLPLRVIDLGSKEKDRWKHVVEQDYKSMRALAKQAMQELKSVSPLLLSPTLHLIFRTAYELCGGMFLGELKSLARGMNISASLATVLNCTYELSHVGGAMRSFGCTAAIKKTKDCGLVLVRNLDWPLSKIGKATRIFKFVDRSRHFLSVGVAGYVGVLSGMLPGKYAVTINWAPPYRLPSMKKPGASFLLRKVLEECNSYKEAVRVLSTCPMSTSAFFTVCGVKSGEACVIERTQTDAAVRKIHHGQLVQANHFVSSKYQHLNAALDDDGDSGVLEFSQERAGLLEKRLTGEKTFRQTFNALDEDWVLNGDTTQQMAFCPKTGEMKVGRWT
jgi:predicted choloylglycine hydrolase